MTVEVVLCLARKEFRVSQKKLLALDTIENLAYTSYRSDRLGSLSVHSGAYRNYLLRAVLERESCN